MQVVTGTIYDYDPETNKWCWYCGLDGCNARSNPPVAIKGMQRVKTVCKKCGSFNTVSRFK